MSSLRPGILVYVETNLDRFRKSESLLWLCSFPDSTASQDDRTGKEKIDKYF